MVSTIRNATFIHARSMGFGDTFDVRHLKRSPLGVGVVELNNMYKRRHVDQWHEICIMSTYILHKKTLYII